MSLIRRIERLEEKLLVQEQPELLIVIHSVDSSKNASEPRPITTLTSNGQEFTRLPDERYKDFEQRVYERVKRPAQPGAVQPVVVLIANGSVEE